MDKRENLAARYERVLGRPLPEVDHEDALPEGLGGHGSTSRRREQVLQAQRTHRHRTQQYIRELEKEVFRLRDVNDGLQRTLDEMRTQMAKMSMTSVQSDPSLMELRENSDRQQQLTNNLPVTTREPDTPSLINVDLTSFANVVPVGSCENHPAEISPPIYQPASTNSSTDTQISNTPSHASPFLSTQLGIAFILALEQPCLSHVKHAHMGYTTGTTPRGIDYNSGPGHLLNASAFLTHRYYKQVDLESQALTLPPEEVEGLLEAAGRLRLDGEITPVQIWERVRKKAKDGITITEDGVVRLMEVLERYVYCNSFGAVIEKGTADMVLAQWLSLYDHENSILYSGEQLQAR